MQTRDEVKGLHNCRGEYSPYFYKVTFLRKKQNSLFMAPIKREILTSHKVLYMGFVTYT